MADAEVPWCPTEVDRDNMEFRENEHDWGICSEDCLADMSSTTARTTTTATTATSTTTTTTTACEGRCSKINQKCDIETGRCQCLEASTVNLKKNEMLSSRVTKIPTTLMVIRTSAGASQTGLE